MTQRQVVRQERQRKVASPAKAREAFFFFLCFTMQTRGPQKDFPIVSSMTPSNGGNGLQHQSASSSSLQGEKERGGRGPAPHRSAADAAPKKNGDQANCAHARGVMTHRSVDRALHHGKRSWEHGSGTPHRWTIIEHVEQKTICRVDLGTCGCVDHKQNFGPQSVESINTSAAHILKRVNLKVGRATTSSHSLGIDSATWLAEIRASEL